MLRTIIGTIFLLGMSFSSQARSFDGLYIVSGNKHSIDRFKPYISRVEAKAIYFGVDVNPNAKSHMLVKDEILSHFQQRLCATKCKGNILVMGWSIGAKFVPYLLAEFPNVKFTVVLLDPMDGAPPFTQANSAKYPMVTKKVKLASAPHTLILSAEKAKAIGSLGIGCDIDGQNYPLFEALFQTTATILPEAGHLDLLQGPFGLLTRMACAKGGVPAELTLERSLDAFEKFLQGDYK